jgi:beta-lactamase regulating signal transducer with metallopeptidase domain
MTELFNEAARVWWGWMGPMLWQVSLLVLVVSAIDLLIGKWAWPQVRYALWLLILVKLVIPPSWSLATSPISRAVPWAQAGIVRLLDGEPARLDREAAATWTGTPSTEVTPNERDAGSLPVVPGGRSTLPSEAGPRGLVWQAYAMAAWVLGMAVLAGVLVLRMMKLRRWHREQEKKKTIPPWFHELMVDTARRIKLERLPAIVFSEEAVAPAVYGVFRPVLLLPANYTENLSPEEAEHVLLHELAHLKRGDLWLHGLCLLLQIVYWFNPLLIWVRKQTRHVRELCCDMTIAGLLKEKTVRYRKTLLDTARELLTESLEPGMGLLGVFEEPFRLVARLRWLEKEAWRRRKWALGAAFLVVAVMVPFVLPMAAFEPQPVNPQALAVGAPDPADLPPGTPGVETCLREEVRTERYVLFFPVGYEVHTYSEFWLGDGRAALVEENRRIILDRAANTLTYVNTRDRSYVVMSMPVDTPAVFSDKLAQKRRKLSWGARVKPTGRTRELQGYRCDEYQFAQWENRNGSRHQLMKARVWATREVEADYTLAEQLLQNLRALSGRDEEGQEELRKIRGKQLRLEAQKQGRFPFKERLVTDVHRITRKKPPRDVYEIPEDYTRKDRLTLADF